VQRDRSDEDDKKERVYDERVENNCKCRNKRDKTNWWPQRVIERLLNDYVTTFDQQQQQCHGHRVKSAVDIGRMHSI